jgi:hypothetical protein
MAGRTIRSVVLERQLAWAEREGKKVGPTGYLDKVEDNLFLPMSPTTLAHFSAGSGGELLDAASRPAKIKALHSSAALAVNVFDYWTRHNAAPLAMAFGFTGAGEGAIREIGFERQYPTGLAGNPPNLDVAIRFGSGLTVAIESKFTEWMMPKPTPTEAFRPAYFPAAAPLWSGLGLPRCQHLAESVAAGSAHFRWLDVPQLVKHALGLATASRRRFSLHYLFFDAPGSESCLRRDEINRFTTLVGQETRFTARSYQELFNDVGTYATTADKAYLDYLGERYFRTARPAAHG